MRVGWIPKASRPSLTLSRKDDALAGAVRSSPLPSGEGGRSGLGLFFFGRFGGRGFLGGGFGRGLFRHGFRFSGRGFLGNRFGLRGRRRVLRGFSSIKDFFIGFLLLFTYSLYPYLSLYKSLSNPL